MVNTLVFYRDLQFTMQCIIADKLLSDKNNTIRLRVDHFVSNLRMPDSKYNHPDAANFNSWRRHLALTGPNPSDDLSHAWEDVKAMFNGGSRKRVMAHSAHSFTKNQDQSNAKRMKAQAENQHR